LEAGPRTTADAALALPTRRARLADLPMEPRVAAVALTLILGILFR
jgi:hypothetical protein